MNRFTRLVVHNWRNFKDVDVALGERVFVAGPNASGKSNLLDVLRFLQELAVDGGGLTNALDGSNRGGIRAVRSLHAGARSEVRIFVEAIVDGKTWAYDLVLQATGTPQKPGPATIEREVVTCDGEGILKRPDPADAKDAELLLATALEQRSANAGFRPLRDFLRGVDYIHVVPQLVRQPNAGDQRRFGKSLGVDLIESMGDTPKPTRDAQLKKIQKALKAVLPQFVEIEWFKDKNGRPHLRAKYQHWRDKGGWQIESSFSDGTLRLIGLLWFLSRGQSPLLLEEPELSLHPAAVRQIPRILAKLNEGDGRQIIMTSHSPDLLEDQGIDPSEVLLLRSTRNGTEVTLGSKEPKLVEAAESGVSLAPVVEALTRPANVDRLARFAS
jgi:predicted ATPase